MSDKRFVIDEAKRRIEEFHAPLRRRSRFVIAVLIVVPLSCCVAAFCIFQTWFERIGFTVFCLSGIIVFFITNGKHLKYFLASGNDLFHALEKRPETAGDYAMRGRAFADAEFYDEAVEDYQKALEMEPDNEEFLDEFAVMLWGEMKDGRQALPYFEKLCGIEGVNRADAFMFRGQILAETDPDAALKSFDRAVEIEPDDSDYPLAKLRFFIDAGQLDQAEEYLPEVEKIVKNESRGEYVNTTWLELRARLALKRGEAENAVKFASQAVRVSPRDKELYEIRAEAYDALGRYDKAEADRRKAEGWK